MPTIRELLKSFRVKSKEKTRDFINDAKNKTSETYNKVLDTDVDELKAKTNQMGGKVKEAFKGGVVETKDDIGDIIPIIGNFILFLVIPYPLLFFYGFIGNDIRFDLMLLSIILVPTFFYAFSSVPTKVSNVRKSAYSALFISFLTFPIVAEYLNYKLINF